MASLLIGAFVAHWGELFRPAETDEWIPVGAFVAILGGLMLVSVCGLFGSIARR